MKVSPSLLKTLLLTASIFALHLLCRSAQEVTRVLCLYFEYTCYIFHLYHVQKYIGKTQYRLVVAFYSVNPTSSSLFMQSPALLAAGDRWHLTHHHIIPDSKFLP